jgi:hypothetical protein
LAGVLAPVAALASQLPVTASFKPLARSCAAPRIARFAVLARHLTPGRQYVIQWSAPTRTGGEQVNQTAFVARRARYANSTMRWRAATALPRHQFRTRITLSAVKRSGDVQVASATKTVPDCTPR